MITAETEKGGEVVHVHLDAAGLGRLIKALSWLKARIEAGERDHLHLMTEDWGGNELSTQPQSLSGNTTLVHHVKIHGWTDKAKKMIAEPTSAGDSSPRADAGRGMPEN